MTEFDKSEQVKNYLFLVFLKTGASTPNGNFWDWQPFFENPCFCISVVMHVYTHCKLECPLPEASENEEWGGLLVEK